MVYFSMYSKCQKYRHDDVGIENPELALIDFNKENRMLVHTLMDNS